jgi:hypothetical protein
LHESHNLTVAIIIYKRRLLKCGIRTKKDMEAGIATPLDEIKETFEKKGKK